MTTEYTTVGQTASAVAAAIDASAITPAAAARELQARKRIKAPTKRLLKLIASGTPVGAYTDALAGANEAQAQAGRDFIAAKEAERKAAKASASGVDARLCDRNGKPLAGAALAKRKAKLAAEESQASMSAAEEDEVAALRGEVGTLAGVVAELVTAVAAMRK